MEIAVRPRTGGLYKPYYFCSYTSVKDYLIFPQLLFTFLLLQWIFRISLYQLHDSCIQGLQTKGMLHCIRASFWPGKQTVLCLVHIGEVPDRERTNLNLEEVYLHPTLVVRHRDVNWLGQDLREMYVRGRKWLQTSQVPDMTLEKSLSYKAVVLDGPKWQIWKVIKSGSKGCGENRCYDSFVWAPDSLQLARSKTFSFLWEKVLGLAQTNGWLWQIKAIHPNASLDRRGQVTLEWTAGVSGEGSMNAKEGEILARWSSSTPI